MIEIKAPVDLNGFEFRIGELVRIKGRIYLARDAVLPKIVREIEGGGFDLEGSILMHGGYSEAGFGVTTSNKAAIESSIVPLSKAGVRVHVGKGELSDIVVKEMDRLSLFVTTPSTNGLFMEALISHRIVLFEEEGMEALHEIVIGEKGIEGIIAAWDGKAIWQKS
jgi:fumarate hydratase subunit beta